MLYLKAFLILILIFIAEILNGIFRGKLLTPRFGDFRARQISTGTGCLSIFFISLISIRWLNPATLEQCYVVGAIWFVFMLIFEIGFGRLVFKFSWNFILQDFNFLQGRLLAFGMLYLVFAPLIAAKLVGLF
jgi:hypothetical protein